MRHSNSPATSKDFGVRAPAVAQRKGPHNKALHQTKRVGAAASRPVIEARFAGEGRCSTDLRT